MSTTINCSSCGASSPAPDPVEKRTCPQCGSEATSLCHVITVTETLQMKESVSLAVKDPSRRSDDKLRSWSKAGDDYWRDGEKWVYRAQSGDRDRDRYFEKVTDPETGEVIHECDEPLSEHRGHGSAANRKPDAESPEGRSPDD